MFIITDWIGKKQCERIEKTDPAKENEENGEKI